MFSKGKFPSIKSHLKPLFLMQSMILSPGSEVILWQTSLSFNDHEIKGFQNILGGANAAFSPFHILFLSF